MNTIFALLENENWGSYFWINYKKLDKNVEFLKMKNLEIGYRAKKPEKLFLNVPTKFQTTLKRKPSLTLLKLDKFAQS